MTIDFDSMGPVVIPNFKGGEKEISTQSYWDGTTRIMKAVLKPGASIGMHKHEGNCEIMFILEGEGTIIDDGVASPIRKGQSTYCPEGHSHSLVNSGDSDLVFCCAVPTQPRSARD